MYSNIPNLINGVSQSAPDKRFPSQVTLQDNASSSAVKGLGKRPPTRHVAEVYSSTISDSWHHPIDRDGSERYILSVTGGSSPDVKVIDLDGNEATVTNSGGGSLSTSDKAYLATSDPEMNLRAVTIGDYTIITNREKVPALGSTTSADAVEEALIFVQGVSGGNEQRVTISASDHSDVVVTYTPTTGQSQAYVANQLQASLNSGLPSGSYYTSRASNSGVIKVWRYDSGTFTIDAKASPSGTISALKETTESITDLPTVGPAGFKIKIKGDAEASDPGYWVEFVAAQEGDTRDWPVGYWIETVAPEVTLDFDEDTMPLALLNTGVDTFKLQPVDWADRLVGDDISNGAPSFIGKPIRNLFFWQNRLGILSGENIILSETSAFFNFWRTTAIQVLDTAVIDVASPATGILTLDSAVPRDEDLLVFSRDTQLVLRTNDRSLSPASVQIQVATTYDTQDVTAQLIGRRVYFTSDRGDYSSVSEYERSSDLVAYEAATITNHVPQYLSGRALQVIGLSTENVLFVRTTGLTNGIYVYQFIDRGTERLQASWSRWTFGTSAVVHSMHLFDDNLYLLIERGGKTTLEFISTASGQRDSYSEFVTHIDRRITEDDVSSLSYSAATGNTTFTLPYTPSTTIQVATRSTASETGGTAVSSVTYSGTAVTIPGDYTSTSLWIGEQYEMRVELTKPFPYQDTRAISYGTFKVRYGEIQYSDTAVFQAEVSVTAKDSHTYRFSGQDVGSYTAVINQPPALLDGKFRVPIFEDSTYVTLTLKNDTPLPCNLTQLTWEGKLRTR